MKIKYTRFHKVNPAKYESLDFGASVEVDTEADQDFVDQEPKEIFDTLDRLLDTGLEIAVDRALRLGGPMEESHLWDYYERD